MFYAKQEILFDTLIVLFSLQVRSRVWNNPTKTCTAEGIKVVVASPIKGYTGLKLKPCKTSEHFHIFAYRLMVIRR